MHRHILFITALSFVSVLGCSKPESAKPKAGSKAPAAQKTTPSSPATKSVAKAEPAKKVESGKATTKDKKAPPKLSKEDLEIAYVEIYCAKEKGNAAEVFKLFKKYGFSEPKHWTDIWKKAVKDEAWVAKVHQRALNACKNATKPTP